MDHQMEKKSKAELQLNSLYNDASFQADLSHAWRYVIAANMRLFIVTCNSARSNKQPVKDGEY